MSTRSRIGPPRTTRETTSRSVITSSVTESLKDFDASRKSIHFNLASSRHHRLAPTTKELCHETRHSICQHCCSFHLSKPCGAGVGAHSAVSLAGHCSDSREV